MTVSNDTELREALKGLCETGHGVLFVVEDGKLVGSLSDGDVRRHLLAGGSLSDPVASACNRNPRFLFTTERRKAQEFIFDRSITAVPIVDEDHRILDIEYLHESVCVDDVVIRELLPGDMEMAIEFFDQMAGDTRAMFNRGDANRIRMMEHLTRKEDDRQIHFAAVTRNADGSERMVGYVFLWDTDRKLPWLGVAVREDWKGHHLGRKLLEFLDGWARPKGYGGLMLTSVPANVRAHSLYTRMGFEYFGVYPDSEFLYIKRYEI